MTSGPAPHPAAAPAVAAVQRLLDAAGDHRDRTVLGQALAAVRAAYPVPTSPSLPRIDLERDERGWPVLAPYTPCARPADGVDSYAGNAGPGLVQ